MDILSYLNQSKAGERIRLSRAIDVPASLITQWFTGVRTIPPARVVAISLATEWRVTPHELRPDIYPHPDDGLPEHLRGRKKEEAA